MSRVGYSDKLTQIRVTRAQVSGIGKFEISGARENGTQLQGRSQRGSLGDAPPRFLVDIFLVKSSLEQAFTFFLQESA